MKYCAAALSRIKRLIVSRSSLKRGESGEDIHHAKGHDGILRNTSVMQSLPAAI
jgi:hypothetical protein